eukprot:402164-Prymnesium_polylepis.2
MTTAARPAAPSSTSSTESCGRIRSRHRAEQTFQNPRERGPSHACIRPRGPHARPRAEAHEHALGPPPTLRP